MLPEKCIGNCGRDIAVGQTIFQLYLGGYWPKPYITPDRDVFLGNWCVDCFQLDSGGLVRRQMQPYTCSLCGRGFKGHERVIYVTRGTRPAPLAKRAEDRGAELRLIVGKECWTDDRFAKPYELYETYDLQSSTELERLLKRVKRARGVGRKVRHPRFGIGTVIDVKGIDDDLRISISFPGLGTKKFIELYAGLEYL